MYPRSLVMKVLDRSLFLVMACLASALTIGACRSEGDDDDDADGDGDADADADATATRTATPTPTRTPTRTPTATRLHGRGHERNVQRPRGQQRRRLHRLRGLAAAADPTVTV
jgi:hypothetical protein